MWARTSEKGEREPVRKALMTNGARLRPSRTACKTAQWDNIWCANPSVHSNGVPNKKLIHKQINKARRENQNKWKKKKRYFICSVFSSSNQRVLFILFVTLQMLHYYRASSPARCEGVSVGRGSGTCLFLGPFSCFNPRDGHTHPVSNSTMAAEASPRMTETGCWSLWAAKTSPTCREAKIWMAH